MTAQQDKYIINNQCPCYTAAVTPGRMAVTAQQVKYIGKINVHIIYYTAAVTSGRMAVTAQQDKSIL